MILETWQLLWSSYKGLSPYEDSYNYSGRVIVDALLTGTFGTTAMQNK